MGACEPCYRRKTRCDRAWPKCSSCKKREVNCNYPGRRHYASARRHQFEALEARLQNIEKAKSSDSRYSMTRTVDAADLGRPHNASAEPEYERATRRGRGTSVVSTEQSGDAVRQSGRDFNRSFTVASSGPISPIPGSHYLEPRDNGDFAGIVKSVLGSLPALDSLSTSSKVSSNPNCHAQTNPGDVQIPAKSTALLAVERYFLHWHTTFPLLYKPSFMQLVERIYEDPPLSRPDASGMFVFNIVLALGSAAYNGLEWSYKDTDAYFRTAETALSAVLEYRDIRAVQAYLLCCVYGIHASLRDTADHMWELIGRAGRLCVELGLHRSGSAQVNQKSTQHLTGPIPASLQQEMCIRCFWCYYSLERIISVTLRRPLQPSDDDIDVLLPSSLDDEGLAELENAGSPTEQSGDRGVSPFLHVINIRRILSRAHVFLHTSTISRSLSLDQKTAVREELLQELEEWKGKIALLKFSEEGRPVRALSAFTSHSWYEALYHTTVLILFRPSPTFPSIGYKGVEVEDSTSRAIWQASRAVIATYKSVLQARRLNYSWICLYTVFMAGLANIYSVACCAQRFKRWHQAFLPPLQEVVTDVRDCANILIAICERWDDARASCETFDRLSDCAIAELCKVVFQFNHQPGLSEANSLYQTRSIDAMCAAPAVELGQGHQTSEGKLQSDAVNENATIHFGSQDDFQNVFLELQTDVFDNGCDGANEVFMGLNSQWFGDELC